MKVITVLFTELFLYEEAAICYADRQIKYFLLNLESKSLQAIMLRENISFDLNDFIEVLEERFYMKGNENMKFSIHSLYLCVTDMKRAIQFYEDLFEVKPIVTDEIYSVFDIHGFRFGLFAYKKMKENHMFGSNCLPSITVENIDVLKSKIKGLKICFPLTQIGKNWVVEIVDSEENHIEMTTPIS